MLVVGLTGGIGSGKSAVASRLEGKPDVRVIRADDEAKRIMADDPDVRAALVARFGPETFDSDGELDRAGLAAQVFGNEDEVRALNSIVHPAVRRDLRARIKEARADGVRLLVYEAALIYEIGAYGLVDAVILVDAPLEDRVTRVVARDDSSREQVLARAGHQLEPATFRSRADYIIENDGDLAQLYDQVDALYRRLLAEAGTLD